MASWKAIEILIIFRKCNLIHYMHRSILKQDKIFYGYLLALIRLFKWTLDFHGDDFVGFLWLQNFVWPRSTLWIWDLCWPWRLSMANKWEVHSIRVLDKMLNPWVAKYCSTSSEVFGYENTNEISGAHQEVLARMKEIEIFCFNC